MKLLTAVKTACLNLLRVFRLGEWESDSHSFRCCNCPVLHCHGNRYGAFLPFKIALVLRGDVVFRWQNGNGFLCIVD